jgi:RNA polymerase sigma-70 factor, ECF subfamily
MVHLDYLYRIATHLAREPDDAEDLVQEAYARALGSYERFEPGTHLKAWLAKILHNLFYDRYRREKRWDSLDEPTASGQTHDYEEKIPSSDRGPVENILRDELNTKISAAVKRLPEEFRMAVILVDLGDFSYTDAAAILSCPVGTVRSRLSRAREMLREQLKDYVLDDEDGKACK